MVKLLCQTNLIFIFRVWDNCTIFRYTLFRNEFDKMQILILISVYIYTLILNWFGDYRSLHFCAMASVVALFILIKLQILICRNVFLCSFSVTSDRKRTKRTPLGEREVS